MHFFLNVKAVKAWKLFSRGFFAYRMHIVLIALLSLLGGVFEGLGINAVIPLFSFVGGQQDVPKDAISESIARLFSYLHLPYSVTYLLGFIVLLFVAKALFLFVSRYINLRIMTRYEVDTRRELFRHFLRGSWAYVSKQKIGFVDQVMVNDVNRSSGILFHLGAFAVVLISITVYGILIINISPRIALIALLFGVAVLASFRPLFGSYRQFSGQIVKKYKTFGHFINEHLIAMKVVKASGAEEGVFRKGEGYIEVLRALRVRSETLRSISDIVTQPIGVIFIIGVFGFLYKLGTVDFPSFAVMVYAVNRVFSGIQQIQSEVHDINSRVPNLLNVLRFKEEAMASAEAESGTLPFFFEKSLTIDTITFAYGEKKAGISDIRFSIGKGELIGLIGPSGAGKTTLVDILLRLLTPTSGEILLDGIPSREIALSAWRGKIAYVSQEVHLVQDTIENNIRFYDHSLSAEDIRAAAKLAHVLSFIEKQPQGFQTLVGERGNQLSGGERQRIALARALARKPELLILDEATSALDNESEQLIKESIEELRGKMTMIVIAHRLSTVASVDKLLVLQNGRITEEGTPEELLKKEHSYFGKVSNVRTTS